MRLRRQPAQPNRRQRLSEEAPAKLSSFAYSSRQPAQTDRASRQPLSDRPNVSPKRIGLFWLQRIGLLVLLLAIFASAINILRLSPSAEIRPLNQSSQYYLQSSDTYAAAANKLLKSSIWNGSKVTVDATGISQQLLRQFPELTSVSVTMPLLTHRPLIYIEASRPALILNSGSGYFVVDAAGKALAKLNYISETTADLPVLTDQSGLNLKVKQQALPAANVRFAQTVVAELAAKQVTVSNLSLPPASSELDAHIQGEPYYVKFNLQDTDPAGEAGTFLATINGLNKQKITPSQYVDVRVAGRAYYK